MLQRSPTYIASLPGINPLTRLIRKVLPARWAGTGAAVDERAGHPGLVPSEPSAGRPW